MTFTTGVMSDFPGDPVRAGRGRMQEPGYVCSWFYLPNPSPVQYLKSLTCPMDGSTLGEGT